MSLLNDNRIRIPGDYKMHYVRLFTFGSNDPVDITNLVAYVDIYESIFSPFLTLDIGIIDNISLLEKAPIIGEEFIEIDLRGADNETGLVRVPFFVYKISEKLQISDRGFTYKIHCVSPEAIIDMNLKISKAYSGQPSNLVRDFVTKNLQAKKQVHTQETKNSVSYISNYWSPLENIKFLCDRSVAKETHSPSYVFYETKKSFIYTTLDELVSQPSSYQYFYTINPKVTETNNKTNSGVIDQRMKIIEKLYVDESFDYIKKLKTGAFGNRVLTVNPLDKSYAYSYYDFIESFKKFSRLNELPFNSDSATRRLNATFRHRMAPTMSHSNMKSELNNEWFKQRLTEMSAISSQSIQIDVPGRFNIYAGNVIDAVIFSGEAPVNAAQEKDFSSLLDRVLSGRYLVTSIKHSIDKERHSMSLQLNKDSLLKVR